MRDGGQVHAMKAILEVRRLQQLAAEKAAVAAANALRTAEEQRDKSAERIRADQDAWNHAVGGATMSLVSAGLWATQIARGEVELSAALASVRTADDQRRRCADEWRASLARADAADNFAAAVSKKMRRAREEAALNEQADRASRKGAAA